MGHVLLFPRVVFFGTFSIHIEVRRVASIQVMCWGPCNHGSVMTCPSTSQWVIYHLVLGLGRYEVFFLRPSRSRRSDFHRVCFGNFCNFFWDKKPGKRWNATRLQIDLANRSCEYNTENIHPKMTFDRCFPLRILYIFKENLDLLCWFVIGQNSSSRTLLTMSKMVVSLPKRRFRLCSPSLKVWESWCSYS